MASPIIKCASCRSEYLEKQHPEGCPICGASAAPIPATTPAVVTQPSDKEAAPSAIIRCRTCSAEYVKAQHPDGCPICHDRGASTRRAFTVVHMINRALGLGAA